MYREADETSGRKLDVGQKQKIQAEADSENTSGPHDESQHPATIMVAAAGGGHYHVESGGSYRPHHILWAACI